jgi:hypothetical protein
MLTGVATMPRLAALLLLLAGPAMAQSNWPTQGSINQDFISGSIDRLDRLGSYPPTRVIGEDRRERITGWLGGVQEWVEERADRVGQRDREAVNYFNLRRSWERDWIHNR